MQAVQKSFPEDMQYIKIVMKTPPRSIARMVGHEYEPRLFGFVDGTSFVPAITTQLFNLTKPAKYAGRFEDLMRTIESARRIRGQSHVTLHKATVYSCTVLFMFELRAKFII